MSNKKPLDKKKEKVGSIALRGQKRSSDFNYEKDFETLLKNDDDGFWIYWAGTRWKEFDYARAFNALIEKENISNITSAGEKWPQGNFDYAKALDVLIKKDKEGLNIKIAGEKWPVFNYQKGFFHLIQKDKTGAQILAAGKDWRRFDYSKAFRVLRIIKNKKRTSQQQFESSYDRALKQWPKEEVKKEKKRMEGAKNKKNASINRKKRKEIKNLSSVLSEETKYDMDKYNYDYFLVLINVNRNNPSTSVRFSLTEEKLLLLRKLLLERK